MSSFDRRRFIGLAALPLLAGCFRPMLAENSPGSNVLGRVALPKITNRFSYHLHERLEDRLGKPQDTKYRLVVRTTLTRRGLAVTQDNDTTRRSLIITADWSLFENGIDTAVIEDQIIIQSGLDSVSSLFAERVTSQDIERRLAEDLGERIARRVLASAPGLETTPVS